MVQLFLLLLLQQIDSQIVGVLLLLIATPVADVVVKLVDVVRDVDLLIVNCAELMVIMQVPVPN